MKPRSPKRKKLMAAFLSLLYTICMMYLLFLRRLTNGRADHFRLSAQTYGYRRTVRNNINLVPFRTIRRFYRSWCASVAENGFDPLEYGFINNVGNVLLFVPLGILLPYFWKSQRNPLVFLFTTAFLIVCVEVTQGLLLLGSCDIDDLILNTAGAAIGYLFYMLIYLIRKKRESYETSNKSGKV